MGSTAPQQHRTGRIQCLCFQRSAAHRRLPPHTGPIQVRSAVVSSHAPVPLLHHCVPRSASQAQQQAARTCESSMSIVPSSSSIVVISRLYSTSGEPRYDGDRGGGGTTARDPRPVAPGRHW
eukprot:357713-Chlamydomonas_euryale.AAC.14